jgi:hypothetical protein
MMRSGWSRDRARHWHLQCVPIPLPAPAGKYYFSSVTIRSSSPIVAFRRGESNPVRDGFCPVPLPAARITVTAGLLLTTTAAVSVRAQHKGWLMRTWLVLEREQNPCEQAQKEGMQQVLCSVFLLPKHWGLTRASSFIPTPM